MDANFKDECFTYVTVRDLFRHILDTDFEQRHLGRLAMDRVLAKIIWDRDACDFLHHFHSDDDDDITVLDLSKGRPQNLDNYVTCDDAFRLALDDIVRVTQSQETVSSSNTEETNYNSRVQGAKNAPSNHNKTVQGTDDVRVMNEYYASCINGKVQQSPEGETMETDSDAATDVYYNSGATEIYELKLTRIIKIAVWKNCRIIKWTKQDCRRQERNYWLLNACSLFQSVYL